MAVKFYPPILEGTLPSFIKNKDGTVNLTVPFSMNPMVAVSEVEGLILRIKTTTTNTILTTTKNVNDKAAFIDYEATFKLTAEEGAHLVVGQSYKFQLAYFKGKQVGYYSNLAIIKCTDQIDVTISNLYAYGRSNVNITKLIGKYMNSDTTEKVYQYQFVLFNDDGTEELENSGWLNHNVYMDVGDGSSIDEYEISYNMKIRSVYKAQYRIRTNTYKEVSSKLYPITIKLASSSTIVKTFPEGVRPLVSRLNFDNAYIKVKIGGREEKEALQHLYDLAHSNVDARTDSLSKAEIKLLASLLVNNKSIEDDYENVSRSSPIYARDEGNRYILDENGERIIESDPHNPLLDYTAMALFINEILIDEKQKTEQDSAILALIKQIKDAQISGTFILERTDSNSHFTRWEKIWKKNLDNVYSDFVLFTDYLIEQGVIYLYSLRQVNSSGVYSERDLTDYLTADYEDTFLYDGHRQLKLRFNVDVPKLSRILSENKKNMIGSKYPFIFRNGIIDYKEFQLKGMMTAYNDNDDDTKEPWDELRDDIPENHKEGIDRKAIFVDKITINKLEDKYPKISSGYYFQSGQKIQDAQLADYLYTSENEVDEYGNIVKEKTSYKNYRANSNIDLDNSYIERVYKLAVWHWLSDGKVKLFKSSQEGCYLIRLLNVSISPSAKLGGLIHSFDSQAEEIGDFVNLDDARYFGLLPEDDEQPILVRQEIKTIQYGADDVGKQLNEGGQIYYIKIEDAIPGTHFTLTKRNGDTTSIMVGATGSFELDSSIESDNYYISIQADDDDFNKKLLSQKGNNNQIVIFERSNASISKFDEIDEERYSTIPAVTINAGKPDLNIISLFESTENDEEKESVIEIPYAKFMRMDILDIGSLEELQTQANEKIAVESMLYAVPNGDNFKLYKVCYEMPLDWKCLRKQSNGSYYYVSTEINTKDTIDSLVDAYYLIELEEPLSYSVSIDYLADDKGNKSYQNYKFDLTNNPEMLFEGFYNGSEKTDDNDNNVKEKKSIIVGNGVQVELGMSIKVSIFTQENQDDSIVAAVKKKNAAQIEYYKAAYGLSLVELNEQMELDKNKSYIYIDPDNPYIESLSFDEASDYDTDYLYTQSLKDLDYKVINQKFADYEKARLEYEELAEIMRGEDGGA